MGNINIIKGAQELSGEELSAISGGATGTYDGETYEYPDSCPFCKQTDVLSHYHQFIFVPVGDRKYKASGIICYREHQQGSAYQS